MKSLLIVSLAGTLVLGGRIGLAQDTPPVEAAPPSPSVVTVETLDQRLGIIERLQENAADAEAERAKTVVTATAGGRDGFTLRSADAAWQLKVWGLVQEDARIFVRDRWSPAASTVLLRRVRPGLDVTLDRAWRGRILPDFGGGNTVLYEAYLEWRPRPELGVQAGKFKPPLGFEQFQSDAVLPFSERGFVSALLPTRDIGVQLSGDAAEALVSYAAGIYNGAPDGGVGEADGDDKKDGAGRVFVQPFRPFALPWLDNFGLGVGGTYGIRKGSAASAGLPAYKTPGQQTWFTYSGTPTGTAKGTLTRVAPQAAWFVDRFGLVAEAAREDQQILDAKAKGTRLTVRTTAWQTEGTVVLTGEHPGFRGTRPRHALGAGGAGAVEVTGRVHELKVGRRAFSDVAGVKGSAPASAAATPRIAHGWSAGVNWYPTGNVKLAADYEHTRFTGGAAGGGNREPEQLILLRVQLTY